MLGVIVGHESVGIGIDFIQEWNHRLLEDLEVEWGIHDPSNIQMPVCPLMLIPAQTCTLTGCLALQVHVQCIGNGERKW